MANHVTGDVLDHGHHHRVAKLSVGLRVGDGYFEGRLLWLVEAHEPGTFPRREAPRIPALLPY